MVQQATGGRYDHVHAVLEDLHLGPVVDTALDQDAGQLELLCMSAERIFRARGELAGRHQEERARRGRRVASRRVAQTLQYGQAIGQCPTRSVARQREHVPPGEDARHGFPLQLSWFRVSLFGKGAHKLRPEAEAFECRLQALLLRGTPVVRVCIQGPGLFVRRPRPYLRVRAGHSRASGLVQTPHGHRGPGVPAGDGPGSYRFARRLSAKPVGPRRHIPACHRPAASADGQLAHGAMCLVDRHMRIRRPSQSPN